MTKIAPSILAADFSALGKEVQRLEKAGAELVHIDVMDGNFVPPITIGAQMVKALRPFSKAFFDVHLMVTLPQRQLESMIAAGADGVTIHLESQGDTAAMLRDIRRLGAQPAVCINPDTPVETLFPYLDQVDMVLMMSVFPGYGGQKYIPESTARIAEVCREIERRGLKAAVEVDGGINESTAAQARDAGATILVAGSYLFNAPDMAEAVCRLRG
ncbi:MAG: ribulose-phosphate 3-epimerase [Eubacteriales bacterium]|nr:ribulose-phosphate 3-epimerase [Eubacteriales bacterium]